jgi:hypothetical protein
MKRLVSIVSLSLLGACAPGEPVGKVDAMKPSSLDVELAAGEKLRFRVDAEGILGPPHDDLRRSDAVGFLQKSQVAISVKGPAGATTVRCPIKGNGMTEGKSGAKLFAQGIIVSCEVPIAQAGKHQVSATMVWDPAFIKPLSASVEVRRVKK